MPQEDRNKFYNASKYYLVDIFNGEPKISNVHLEKIIFDLFFHQNTKLNDTFYFSIYSFSKLNPLP